MTGNKGKQLSRNSVPRLLMGGGGLRAHTFFRLDVREDANGKKERFARRGQIRLRGGRTKLFHYLAAGGMQQLRRTSADEVVEERRRSFLIFLAGMMVLWLVFYFFPACG